MQTHTQNSFVCSFFSFASPYLLSLRISTSADAETIFFCRCAERSAEGCRCEREAEGGRRRGSDGVRRACGGAGDSGGTLGWRSWVAIESARCFSWCVGVGVKVVGGTHRCSIHPAMPVRQLCVPHASALLRGERAVLLGVLGCVLLSVCADSDRHHIGITPTVRRQRHQGVRTAAFV